MTTYDKVRKWEEKMREETGQVTIGLPKIIALFQKYLEQVEQLKNEADLARSIAFEEWHSNVESIFRRTFGEDGPETKQFKSIGFRAGVISFHDKEKNRINNTSSYKAGLDKAGSQIRSAITMLSEMGVPLAKPTLQKPGTNINVSPVFNQDNHMRQSQTQTLNAQQIIESIENTLGEGLLEQIKPELEAYKENPNKWANAQKLAVKILDFGLAYAPLVISLLSLFLKN